MGKISINTDFTQGTIFTGASGTANTSAVLTISAYDEVIFYATGADTAVAAYVATITAQVSPDGTNFYAYDGLIGDAGTAMTGVTLNTSTTDVFSLRHTRAIRQIRFEATQNAATAASNLRLRYSARKTDE